MSDSIYVKVGDAVQQLELGAAPEYVQRIEALEAGQTTQDTAISNAASAASTADAKAVAAQQTADSALAKDSVLPGTVIPFAGNPSSTPSGYLLCNGAAVSRTTYAALFAAIGTTYGAGDGLSTFNLPNLTDKFIQGSGTAGTVKAAGLPNIEGRPSFGDELYKNDITPSGAYKKNTSGQKSIVIGYAKSTVSTNTPEILFDASKSNTIYGASNTVQPPALTMRYYIKY